jgi:hypothetical protein
MTREARRRRVDSPSSTNGQVSHRKGRRGEARRSTARAAPSPDSPGWGPRVV